MKTKWMIILLMMKNLKKVLMYAYFYFSFFFFWLFEDIFEKDESDVNFVRPFSAPSVYVSIESNPNILLKNKFC
jgi:hypothetical protein